MKRPAFETVQEVIDLRTFQREQELLEVARAWDGSDSGPLPLGDETEVQAGDFPLDTVPEDIAAAFVEAGRFVDIDTNITATIGISSIATAMRKSLQIEERKGLKLFPSFFFCGIAHPGERKSAAFSVMTQPIVRWEIDTREAAEAAEKSARLENELISIAVAAEKSRMRKPGADVKSVAARIEELESGLVPVKPMGQVFTSDCTEQQIVRQLGRQGEVLGIMTGEGRQVVDHLMGRYSGGQGMTGDAIYLAGISGDRYARNRVGTAGQDETVTLHNPCLNVCIMLQPDKFAALASHEALVGSGLVARLFPVPIRSRVGQRFESKDGGGLNTGAMLAYNQAIETLLDWEPSCDEHGRVIPHQVHLPPEVVAARIDLANSIERRLGAQGDYRDVTGIASKAVSQVVRLALVLHYLHRRDLLSLSITGLSLDVWEKAVKLGQFYLDNAVRCYRRHEAEASIMNAKRILAWAKSGRVTSFTKTEFNQTFPRPRLTPQEWKDAVDVLTEPPYRWLQFGTGKRWKVFPGLHI